MSDDSFLEVNSVFGGREREDQLIFSRRPTQAAPPAVLPDGHALMKGRHLAGTLLAPLTGRCSVLSTSQLPRKARVETVAGVRGGLPAARQMQTHLRELCSTRWLETGTVFKIIFNSTFKILVVLSRTTAALEG